MKSSIDLRDGAQLFWNVALEMKDRYGHSDTGLYHLLLALLERHGVMAEEIASGLNAKDYRRQLEKRLQNDDVGASVKPEVILKEAQDKARKDGKEKVSERDLAAILLEKDGWTLLEKSESGEHASSSSTTRLVSESKDGADPHAESGTLYRPRAQRPTPTLEKFGRDLCREALDGELPVILGRDAEMEAIMETLCRWTKRNPLLIGPAGVGKTAIVEGLANRVVCNTVPPPIRGIRIFALQASALVSGASVVGKLEERMQAILKEASQDGIVLFIDEVHSIVGRGGQRQISDIGSQLKPALAKGDISCLGATTDAEFHQFIEEDRALERRFQPLRVQELSTDATMTILQSLKEKAQRERHVAFSQETLDLIILLAQQHLKNRHLPDKAIDILEQCTAHAVLHELSEMTPSTVHEVVGRMIGRPVDLGKGLTRRLNSVREKLRVEAFCPDVISQQIVKRLSVTARGLDVKPTRANAILFVAGAPGKGLHLTAEVLAEALYGNRERLIEVDMTRFTHASDVNWLIGAPPGYIGHERSRGFQLELAQQPWSVLHFKNVSAGHPQVQEVLAQAFRTGSFTDARESKVYLSDTTIVMTASVEGGQGKHFGFNQGNDKAKEQEREWFVDATALLVPELAQELDASWTPVPLTLENVKPWIRRWVLPPLTERYRRQGLQVSWDTSVIQWLAGEILESKALMKGEGLLEEKVLLNIIPHIGSKSAVVISYDDDEEIRVRSLKGD